MARVQVRRRDPRRDLDFGPVVDAVKESECGIGVVDRVERRAEPGDGFRLRLPRRGGGILLGRGRERGRGLLVLCRSAVRIPFGESLVAAREFLLELGGVQQHQSGEVDGPLGAVDRLAESGCRQMRDETAVIEMRVREQQRVDLTRLVGERHAVADHIVRAALEHSAIDDDARAVGLEQILRTRHRARRAEKVQAHPSHHGTRAGRGRHGQSA